MCFLRESSPLGLQGFPGRQVGFPQICVCECVCALTRWGYFSSTQASGSSGLARDQQCALGDTSMGAVFGHWNESHTHALFQLPLHVRTHSNTRVNTPMDTHTLIYLPTTIQTHTYTHAAQPQTIYHIAVPQILSESLQRTEKYLIWAEVSMRASMVEGLNVTIRKERFPL